MSTAVEQRLRPEPGTGAEMRATLRIAVPLAAAQVAAFSGNVVDVILAGHLSAHVLGAVSIGAGMLGVPLVGVLGIMLAVAPTVAQLDGACRRGETGAVFRQALWLGFGVGLVMQAVLYFGGPALLGVMGVQPALVADAAAFMRAVSFGLPALGIFIACRGFSDGLSMPGPGLCFNLLGLSLLVPTGAVLMYGYLGFPSLGARGSGIANALTLWVQAAAFVTYVARSPRYRGVGRGGSWRPDGLVLAGLLRLGLPMASSVLLEVGMFSLVGLMIARFGEVAAASHQVALNVAALTFMVPMGVANAITVRVGNAAGAGDRAGVRRAGMSGLTLTLCTQAVSSSLMLLFPAAIVGLYTHDAGVLAAAAVLLQLAGIFQVSDGIQVACSGALRGLKDTRMPMLITAIAYWGIGVPVGWFLAFPRGLQVPGMWMGLIAGLSAAAVLLFARFLRLSRRPQQRAMVLTHPVG